MECPRGSGSSAGSALALGDAELLAHEVEPRGLLRTRVLDLQPGVDLEERDQPVLPDQELDGAGAVVAGLRQIALADSWIVPAARRTGTARAPPRRASGSGAAASSRGCRRRSRCRAGRPAPAPRRGAACPGSARRSTRRGRTPRRPRGPPSRNSSGSPPALAGDLHPAAAAAERRLDRDRQAVLVGERLDLVGARRPGRGCPGPAARRRASRCAAR